MLNIISIVSILLCFKIVNSQEVFEGKVVYKNTFISKLPNLSEERLIKLIGTEQEFFIKEGKYLSITNGITMPFMLYLNSDNRIYTKKGVKNDTIFCIDAAMTNNKVIKSQITIIDEYVLGYKCRMLSMTISNGTIFHYYFSEKLKINSDLFLNHNYNRWFDYLKQTKSVPLKIIMENKQLIMTTIATSVEQIILPNNKFEISKGSIIKCDK